MVRPRALAVFILMTRSNLVGCSTGRSLGFAPLRILPGAGVAPNASSFWISSERLSTNTRAPLVPPALPCQPRADAIDDRQLFGRDCGGIRIEAAYLEIPLA